MRVEVEREIIRPVDDRHGVPHMALIGVDVLSLVPVQPGEAKTAAHQDDGHQDDER